MSDENRSNGQNDKSLEFFDKFLERVEKSHAQLHEKMGEKLDAVHSAVQETRSDVSQFKTEMKHELKALHEEDNRQNKALEEQHATLVEHSNRSTQLERDNDLRDKQLRAELFKDPNGAIPRLKEQIRGVQEAAEAPTKWIKGTVFIVGGLSAVGGFILVVLKIMSYW